MDIETKERTSSSLAKESVLKETLSIDGWKHFKPKPKVAGASSANTVAPSSANVATGDHYVRLEGNGDDL
jgi:hypothetical protein